MARAPVLGGLGLSPFGTGGIDFGAFNIVDKGQEAYLVFVKVETAYEAGKATDDEYLAALDKYATALGTGTAEGINARARYEQTKYRIERNVLVKKIDDGSAQLEDLVAFDKSHLTGLNENSDEYRQRLDLYQSSQSQWFSEREKDVVQQYQDGKLTTTQLQQWYREALTDGTIDRNPDLTKSITDRIGELDDRLVSERDAKMLQDYSDGKVATATFLAYANAAKARYAVGTSQYDEWTGRIEQARDAGSENDLLYRYGLSQKYADLKQFIASNSSPKGGTSTSTSTRVILGSDGQWHTVKTTTTKATAPSASEQAAWKKLQVEIADAKRQMAEIEKKVAGVGGWASTEQVMTFYQKQLSRYAKGSADWYRVQGKIDSLNDRLHQESVLSKQGIKITYPGGFSASSPAASTPAASGGGGGTASRAPAAASTGTSIDSFMAGIAKIESGGRYDARNSRTGAFGKYQILPSNWAGWARAAGLPADAPMTPENQERVAKAKMADYYRLLGDWRLVAVAWHSGYSAAKAMKNGAAATSVLGPAGQHYLNYMSSYLGTNSTAGLSGGGGGAVSGSSTGTAGTPASASPAPKRSGPLTVITGAETTRRTGAEAIHGYTTGFPAGLDSAAFEKFYSNYERAYESGAESFVDYSTGKAVAYFIGDDADERIDRMRQLDDLKVKMYQERVKAYQGTPSEITAANALNNTIQDAARHEYLILDTASKSTITPSRSTNPIAAGVRLLDKVQAGVKSELDLARAAWDRGDVTSTYLHLQEAQRLSDPKSNPSLRNVASYGDIGAQAIAAIQRQYGGITPGEALGDQAGTIQKDLERLTNFDDELRGLWETGGEKTNALALLSDLKKAVKVDGAGNVIFDEAGPKGQVVLNDGYFYRLKNGKVELVQTPASGWDQSGKPNRQEPNTVKVRVRVGGSQVVDAMADFQIGTVGYFVSPDGTKRAIQGKVVSQIVDGKEYLFVENPLDPGHWSSSQLIIKTGSGFKATQDPKDPTKVLYTFTVPTSAKNQGQYGGWTYTLALDQATGVYNIYGSKPGGFLSSPVDMQLLGNGSDADIKSLFSDAGFARDASGLAGDGLAFSDVEAPVLGMTASQYRDYLNNFQSPAIRNARPALGATDWTKNPRLRSEVPDVPKPQFGGLAPDERDTLRSALPKGATNWRANPRLQSEVPQTKRAPLGANDWTKNPRLKEERAVLPTITPPKTAPAAKPAPAPAPASVSKTASKSTAGRPAAKTTAKKSAPPKITPPKTTNRAKKYL